MAASATLSREPTSASPLAQPVSAAAPQQTAAVAIGKRVIRWLRSSEVRNFYHRFAGCGSVSATLAGVNPSPSTRRTRADLCPGVLRPWPAPAGALVRLRVPGGRVSLASLAALREVAARFGDDDNVYVTTRANLQLRALPTGPDGRLPDEVVAAITGTGLLPSAGHELVR